MRVTSRGESQADGTLGSSGLIALLAFLVPAIVFGVALVGILAWESGQAALRKAKDDARTVIERSDSQLRDDLRALTAVAKRISGTPIAQARPSPENVAFNAELFPHWIGSMVWSLESGTTVFSSFPGEALPVASPAWIQRLRSATGPLVGGIEPIVGTPAVLIHIPVPNDPRRLVVTTAVRPERFQELLMRRASASGVSAIVDREGRFIARSRDFEQRVGTAATTFVQDAIKRGGAGDYRGRTLEGLENYSAYHTSGLSGWSTHFAIANNLVDAPLPWAVWTAAGGGLVSLLLAGGLVWLLQRDARRRHRAERSMANARQVETLGRLTGGIAHDFNNLLTVIIGSLERGMKRSPDTANAKEVALALEAARRAAALTRSLLLYSRQQAAETEITNVNACMSDAAEVVRRTMGALYEVELDLDASAGHVRADSAHLASAILNLAVNARDAMPAGGTITIRTKRRDYARAQSDTGLAAGEYVEVSVCDNGPGMSADIARRAFDPFFTTKDVGQGTGLGLAQVDAFARANGGVAELETTPGQGVRVSLIIPAAASDATKAAVDARPDLPVGLRVLLVEDEPGVRVHALALLADLACEVVECGDAKSAYAALEGDRFDVLFTDIILPGGVSGVGIAEHVEKHYPATAIVLATGYADTALNGKATRWPLILKPYGLAELSAALASALSRGPSSGD